MAIVSEEVLLGRVRRESEARAAELARLRADLAALGTQIEEKIDRLAARFRSTSGGRATESSALIESIRRVVAGEGYALAEIVDRLEARVGDNAAATAEQFLRTTTTATSALAEWGVILTARINENHAYATTTLQAFADTTSAMAQQVTELESTVNDPATGLVVAMATATATLETHATDISATATSLTTLGTSLTNLDTELSASITSLQSTKVDADGARAQAELEISAQLTSVEGGTIGAKVKEAAEAYIDPLGNVELQWGVQLDDNDRITGKIQLNGSNGSSTLDLVADKIRLFNGATDVPPFRLEGNIIYLQHVRVDTLDAGIHISSPHIIGGELRLAGNCLVCNTSDESLIRINGGDGDGPTRGGQIDLFGNGYATTDFKGSILLTPGQVDSAEVRIRDRTGHERIVVQSDGKVEVSSDLLSVTDALTVGGALNVGGSAHIDNNLDVDGSAGVQAGLDVGGNLDLGGSLDVGGGVAIGGDSLIRGQHKLHFDGDGNGTYIMESFGLQLWGTEDKPVQIMGSGVALKFGTSVVKLREIDGRLYVTDIDGTRML